VRDRKYCLYRLSRVFSRGVHRDVCIACPEFFEGSKSRCCKSQNDQEEGIERRKRELYGFSLGTRHIPFFLSIFFIPFHHGVMGRNTESYFSLLHRAYADFPRILILLKKRASRPQLDYVVHSSFYHCSIALAFLVFSRKRENLIFRKQ